MDKQSFNIDVLSNYRKQRVDDLLAEGWKQSYNDTDIMKSMAEQAYDLAATPNEKGEKYERGMAIAVLLMANYYSDVEIPRECMENAQKGLAMLNTGPDDLYWVVGMNLIAMARFNLGDYAEGLSQETEILKMIQKIGNKEYESKIYSALAYMHFQLEHGDMAIEMMQQALEISHTMGDPNVIVMQLNNMAWIQCQSGYVEDALETSQQALDLCQKINIVCLEVIILDTISAIYLLMNNYDLAEEYEIKCMSILDASKDIYIMANGEIRLAEIFSARGEWDKAIVHAEKALELKKTLEKPYDLIGVHRMLTELYENAGNIAASLEHMKQLYNLESERSKHQTDSRVTDIRAHYQVETAKKDAEIYRLRAIALESEVAQRQIDQIRLETENSMDPLTGLFNRRHLPVLKELLHENHLSGNSTSILMLDIDHFKNVNDTYGHLAGDQIIMGVAEAIKANCRENDIPIRFGGEEFLVFLNQTKEKEALDIADNIRRTVSQKVFHSENQKISVTISVGVAVSSDAREEELRSFIDRVDQALYQAKESGRNQVKLG